MSLLQMSIQGAVLILVITVIRTVFINKLPKKTFLALWTAAVVRLLAPVRVPCALSIYSFLNKSAHGSTSPEPFAAVNVNDVFRYIPSVQVNNVITEAANISAGKAPTPFIPIWTIVWFAGAVICALAFALGYLRSIREFKTSLPLENELIAEFMAEHKQKRRISVRYSDRISAPLTYGVIHPVILMPKQTNWDNAETLSYVLMHEYVHIRRFDSISKLVIASAVCLHWFNPMAWVMFSLANRDLELSCDEAVLRYFDKDTGGKSAREGYANALIAMEEWQAGFMPLSSSFSSNAIEERITAIMKTKKTTYVSLALACCLVMGTVTAFATSAVAERIKDNITTQINDQTITSFTDKDGIKYYSLDGGNTFGPMTDDEFENSYLNTNVEWWTAEGYAAWLENEKEELSQIIGEKGWTPSTGWFTWTQEMVDETVKMYEGTLKQIKKGYKVSKSVNGSKDIMLAQGTDDMFAASEFAMGSELPPLGEYEPFGITFNEQEKALYYNGEKIRYFEDSVDVGSGGISSRCVYCREDGTVSLHTVRQIVNNPDGSTDPFGPIIRMERFTKEEAQKKIEEYYSAELSAVTYAYEDIANNAADTKEQLSKYEPFGLTYNIDLTTGRLTMFWGDKKVRSIFDPVTKVWIANSMGEGGLGKDAVDLEAVYENGKLTGFKIGEQRLFNTGFEAACDYGGTSEGIPVAGMFDKYRQYGITYSETLVGDRAERNLYYNGKPVNKFADISPDGSVFTFGSTSQSEDGLIVHVRYENGKRIGVEVE